MHERKLPKMIVRDMDSSESPTYFAEILHLIDGLRPASLPP